MHITLNKTQNNNPKFEQQRDQEDECKKTKGKADNFIKQNKFKKKRKFHPRPDLMMEYYQNFDDMDPILKKHIQDKQKHLKEIELFIAAGKGDVYSVKRLIEQNADVDFADSDGNTALHYAVRSGNLDVVVLLLDKVKDANTENNENESPLDVASRLPNKGVTEALGQKVADKSFKLLKETVLEAKANDTVRNMNIALTQIDQEIRNTKDKIKYCLDAIDKIKEPRCDEKNLSYEQANVLIYFLEAFSLEGSGDEDVKSNLKEHFSHYYSENDRRIISDARDLLLKKSDKKIRLEDVRKFVRDDIKSFFKELKKYVQCVQNKFSSDNKNNEIQPELSTFLNVLEKQDRKIGEKMDDSRAFLRAQFEKIIAAAYGNQEMTPEQLFSFTMNFYPAFKNETNGGFKELTDLRNKLIHEFHKYGHVEFGNAIYSLRSRLFKYYYAQEVLKIINCIKPDENPETINRNIQRRLSIFKEQFKTGYGAEQVISQEDAKGSLGYVFSRSLFPERDDSGIEELVDQYLKFMVFIDCEKEEEYDLSETGREEESMFDPNEADQEVKPHYQPKEPSDVDRREIFEKFCKLKRIKNYCSTGYPDEMQKLRNELTKIYGVNGYHFDKVCANYIERNNEFSQKDKIVVKEIAKTISNLKKLKDNYKLSNQVIISLYDHLFGKQGFSFSQENQSLFMDMDKRMQREIKRELPRDKTLKISVGNEIFCIRTGKVISNMLKTFYNAYHKYQVEFNVEEIFNDDIFLDDLIKAQIKEKDMDEAVDSHFKLVVFIYIRNQKQRLKIDNPGTIDLSEVLRVFQTLKKCKEHCCDQDYNAEKEILKKKVVNKNWLSDNDFDEICELFVENDSELEITETEEVEKVKRVVKNLKSLGFPWKTAIILHETLKNGKGKLNLEDLSFLKGIDKDRKKKVKSQLEKLYTDDLAESDVKMSFGNGTANLSTLTAVAVIIETFKDGLQFKNSFFIYTVIKKLLNVGYCAPYIAKLITKLSSDDVIERNDLLHLLDILLKKEKGLYIKHVLALLSIESGKLNLYQEICKKIIELNVNIENMCVIFKEPYHLNKCLKILKGKFDTLDNSERTKFLDLIKETVKLLNNIAYEMRRSLKHDVALKILHEADALLEKLIQGKLIEKTDVNALETKFQIGRIKNELGRRESETFNKANKTKLHKEALTIFHAVYETLKYKRSCTEEREIKVHEKPLFLLVLSERAYTKQLLGKNTESIAEHENLFQEVVEFVLDVPKGVLPRSDFLNSQRYNKIEKSKNYQELLTFSEESKKYLDILDIKSAVAYSKLSQGREEASKGNSNKAKIYYYEAESICKEVYSYRKTNSDFDCRVVVRAMKGILFVYLRIAEIWLSMGDEQNALQFNFLALQKANEVFEIQKEIFWPNHVEVLKTRKGILKLVRGISKAYSAFGLRIGKNSLKREEAEWWCKKSLKMNENICEILSQLYGEKYYLTLTTMYDIGSTKFRLGRKPEAKAIMEKVYGVQTELFGEHDKRVLKTKNLLDRINGKLTSNRSRLF